MGILIKNDIYYMNPLLKIISFPPIQMLPQRHNKSMQDKNYILEGYTKSQKRTSSILALPFYFLFLILSPAFPLTDFQIIILRYTEAIHRSLFTSKIWKTYWLITALKASWKKVWKNAVHYNMAHAHISKYIFMKQCKNCSQKDI